MSTIKEILQLQAQAVQAKQDKIQQAALFEAAAKVLRQQADASNPGKFDKTIRTLSREERLEKFGAANRKRKEDDRDADIKAAGWVEASRTPAGAVTFSMPGKPGIQLNVFGNSFSVCHGSHVIQPKTTVTFAGAFLADIKKKI